MYSRHLWESAKIDDAICEDGVFIYRAKESEDGFTVEKIKSQVEYQRIARAYMEMDASEE